MANNIRISKILKEFNIGISTIVEFLKKKGIEVAPNPNEKISDEAYAMVSKEFGKEQDLKEASRKIRIKPISTASVSVSDIPHPEQNDVYDEKEIIIKTNTVEHVTSDNTKGRIAGPKIIGRLTLEELSGKGKKTSQNTAAQTSGQNKEKNRKQEHAGGTKPAEKQQNPENQQQAQAQQQQAQQQSQAQQSQEENQPDKQTTEKPDELITAKQRVSELKGPKIIEKIELPEKGKSGKKKKKKKKKHPHEESQIQVIQPGAPAKPLDSRETAPKTVGDALSGDNADVSERKPEPEFIKTKVEQLSGPNVVGKIDLAQFKNNDHRKNKRKRQRIKKKGSKVNVATEPGKDPKKPYQQRGQQHRGQQQQQHKRHQQQPGQQGQQRPQGQQGQAKDQSQKDKDIKRKDRFKPVRQQVDDDAVQRQVKDTLARLTSPKGKTKSSKYRREKRDTVSKRFHEEMELKAMESNILKVTEFVTVNELATMMNIPVVKVIEACMNLGLMVSINQRLDAEALVVVAEEFGFKVEFITADLQEIIETEVDTPEDLHPRPPIITVMGHVDHGKTSLLDYIRKTNVIAGEAGGITQHIGAYNVELQDGRHITFLDTPGHEAFTAMRARGAKITDVAIIVIAADDTVMPQTVEAINHAVAAGVPMVFAINKIDKPGANPQKIYERLASMNYMVESWGGKYQSQEISAKQGINVDKLLEKVLLEADMLDLKANPNKRASGTIIESSLDKGRGYVTTLLVQNGTLNIGDVILSGTYTGRVKAMFNERQQRIKTAEPATPVLVLGLNGAPAAGETFNVMDEKEAREIANKREQLLRVQDLKTRKHITLEEIGRRIAIGSFKELNIVVKSDVDGSMEALSDSLIKLSTEEAQVNIIHRAVGAISESDVLLAAASNAIIIGFQVRPSANARRLAEKEEIEIRLYSVIYDAINEVRDGIEGMLAPEVKEEITSTVEVLEIFKINKVGSVAGCMVREGKITRHSNIRVIRNGIVVYSGKLGSLKRFKEDVKEVTSGYECGLNIENFNDIKTGDIIESYEQVEIKRKL
jgi:translation initiation factor IF-2